ncbi:hypothetical protein M422DRAFT_276774 [Sphaerobolus stellatus SS14]|uniref:Zn(2)-C6 fungal-type domain-containing protein n=1 Tax=Sphaerobolus stellatus (strain SS14) TaxID=990650 RepID=A0A0C9U168_SPHS4|nr:hypothetical protein M422DRAFT_276774 [Sphaerobolus stellatus SS14]
MEEVPIGDPRRTVQGFVPDNKFDVPAPKLVFDDPYEEEEDHLNKVTKYWTAYDQERPMRSQEEAAKRLEAQKKEAVWDLEKEKEKEKGKEKEAGLSGGSKAKGKGIPKTPKKSTPKKSKRDVRSESKEEEESEEPEERPACVYCVQKKIKCELLDGRKVCTACHKRKVKCEFFNKTAWAVMDGSEKIVEAVRDLTKLERRRTAGLLEKSWYDLDICALNLEQTVDRDLMEADGKVLTLLDMKSRGVEIPADVEKRVMANWGSIVVSYTTHMEHIFTQMNLIWKRMAWTKNDLPESTIGSGEPEAGPSNCAKESGNKRKAEEDEGHMERSEKKKRKKVVETEKEESTMR